MTAGKILGVASAVAGAVGSLLLNKGTFGFEAPAVYMSQELVDQMTARNRRRLALQRAGFGRRSVSVVVACQAMRGRGP